MMVIARRVRSTIWKCLQVENNETNGNPTNVVLRKRKVDRTCVRTYLPSHFVLANSRVNKTRGSRAGHAVQIQERIQLWLLGRRFPVGDRGNTVAEQRAIYYPSHHERSTPS